MKNNILKFSLLAIFALINTLPLLAGPGGGGTEDDGEYDPVPVDNWILLLVLAAVAVGTFFILKNTKKAIA